MLQKLSPREKKLLLFLAIFIFATLFIQIFARVVQPAYASLKLTLEEKKQEVVNAQNLAQEIAELSLQRDELTTRLNEALKGFQVSLDAGYPLNYLDTSDLNLELNNIIPYPVHKTGYYSSLQIDMKVSGAYLSILTYLERIEKLPAVIEVVSPTLTINEDKQVSCEFTLNIYSIDIASEPYGGATVGLGKFDIFTPLVQALASIDSGIDLEADSNKVREDSLNKSEVPVEYTLPSEQELFEEEQAPKDDIYYHFPSR